MIVKPPGSQGRRPPDSSNSVIEKSFDLSSPSNTLTVNNLAPHSHSGTVVSSIAEGDRTDPSGAYPARPEEPVQPYAGADGGTMAAGGVQIDDTGAGTAVNNMPPYKVLNFIVALTGIYPSRP